MTASPHQIRLMKVGIWAFWVLALIFVVTSAGRHNPLRPPSRVRVAQSALLPQGWGFFTRSPREPINVAYAVRDTHLAQISFPNTSTRNLLGLSRSARAMDVELATLLGPILRATWVECKTDPLAHSSWESLRPVKLRNWSRTRYLCGEILIVRTPPVPWAWSSSRERIHMPSALLRLNVECEASATSLK